MLSYATKALLDSAWSLSLQWPTNNCRCFSCTGWIEFTARFHASNLLFKSMKALHIECTQFQFHNQNANEMTGVGRWQRVHSLYNYLWNSTSCRSHITTMEKVMTNNPIQLLDIWLDVPVAPFSTFILTRTTIFFDFVITRSQPICMYTTSVFSHRTVQYFFAQLDCFSHWLSSEQQFATLIHCFDDGENIPMAMADSLLLASVNNIELHQIASDFYFQFQEKQ